VAQFALSLLVMIVVVGGLIVWAFRAERRRSRVEGEAAGRE
jgi:cbb3-type cytochrome oxidase subunit 3